MDRTEPVRRVVASLSLAGCREGVVLDPMGPRDDPVRQRLADWEMPLAPWGGFNIPSGLSIVQDDTRLVLEFTDSALERALVTGGEDWRNALVTAVVLPIDRQGMPHTDRNDCSDAHCGIVFRAASTRRHYYFCLEARRRAVLYRRIDDEWCALASQDVSPGEEYTALSVRMDGDGLVCEAPALGVRFDVTDTLLPCGKVGFRALGRCRVAALDVAMTLNEEANNAHRGRRRARQELALGSELPDPVLVRSYALNELGGEPQFSDFARAGRYDLLVSGRELKAVTAEGEALWTLPEQVREIVFSREATDEGRLLYAMTGTRSMATQSPVTGGPERTHTISDEMLVIRGRDGAVLARRRLPMMDPDAYIAAFTTTSGNLSGRGGTDIVLREWLRHDAGSGSNVWAFDRDLELLWHRQVGVHYGHAWSLQFCDVDGDGRDELLAGGTLFSAAGEVLWVHDREDEMRRINAADHYDAVVAGRLAGDPDVDPVAFLLGGSAGVYVVDALTGRTRMVHRVGHAQGRVVGRVRPELGPLQVLVACRWGNFGILTLCSGRGDRLWSIQPDYIGQGAQFVHWGSAETQQLWTNTSREALALYDGHGHRVKELAALQEAFGDRPRREVGASVVRLGTSPQDLLCLTVDGKMHLFGPEQC